MRYKRDNGQGSFYKRPDGTIQLRITMGKDGNEKYIRKSFYGKTRRECKEKYNAYLNSKSYKLDDRMTVSSWADKWLKIYKFDKVGFSTYSQWEILIRNYIKPSLIGGMLVDEVMPVHLELVMKVMNPYSKSYQEKLKTLLRSLFDKATQNNICNTNPCLNADLKTKKAVRHLENNKHFTSQEVKKIILAHHCTPTIISLATIVMLYTGMRRGEILALQWNDIDFENKVIHVRRSVHMEGGRKKIKDGVKTDEGVRDIPLIPALEKVLSSQKKKSIYIIYDSNYDFYNAKNFSTYFKKFISDIEGVRPLGTHACRHAIATALKRNGVSLDIIGSILGHEDNATTLIYASIDVETERKAMMNLDY